jgi:carbon-monoxide dehydrogenase small subunit
MLMSSKALLDQTPDPTEHQIKVALAGNLCRCTGYTQIVEAVQAAASEMNDTAAAAGNGGGAKAATGPAGLAATDTTLAGVTGGIEQPGHGAVSSGSETAEAQAAGAQAAAGAQGSSDAEVTA